VCLVLTILAVDGNFIQSLFLHFWSVRFSQQSWWRCKFFWDVTACCRVCSSWHFEESFCIIQHHIQEDFNLNFCPFFCYVYTFVLSPELQPHICAIMGEKCSTRGWLVRAKYNRDVIPSACKAVENIQWEHSLWMINRATVKLWQS